MSYAPKTTKFGLHLNGITITWPVLIAVVTIIGNAFVAQYRIAQLESRLDSTAEKARKVDVIDGRITRNAETIDWHRRYEHGGGGE